MVAVRPVPITINQNAWIVPTAAVGLLSTAFLLLLWIVNRSAPTELDRQLARGIQQVPWGSFAFVPTWGSEIGGGLIGFYIAPIGLAVLLLARRSWRHLGLLAAVFLLHFALISPKLFIEAHRPSPAFGVEGGGGLSSFPSGHVQWTVSFWGFVAFLVWQATPFRFRPLVLGAYTLLTVAAMLGRIELGKHWPVDTLAGLIAGLIALRLVTAIHGWRPRSPAPPSA